MKKNQGKALPEVCGPFRGLLTQICWYVVRTFGLRQIDSEIVKEKSEKAFPKVCGNLAFRGLFSIKSLGKAEVFFISVASPVFFDYPPKFHQKSQIYRTPLTGRLAKRSAKIKITPIPNSSLIPCFDMHKRTTF